MCRNLCSATSRHRVTLSPHTPSKFSHSFPPFRGSSRSQRHLFVRTTFFVFNPLLLFCITTKKSQFVGGDAVTSCLPKTLILIQPTQPSYTQKRTVKSIFIRRGSHGDSTNFHSLRLRSHVCFCVCDGVCNSMLFWTRMLLLDARMVRGEFLYFNTSSTECTAIQIVVLETRCILYLHYEVYRIFQYKKTRRILHVRKGLF